jgi:exopolyphosphatase / guanosine-5'-triphosphate,3'-diphosphate pyrophosphatase
MATFAAVDIGANSVRLKIARLVRRRLQVVHEDREVTRLGAAVFSGGQLSPDAIAHTVKVLQRFHRSTQSFGVDATRVVATSALRDARNAAAFVEWVKSATGWRVEVISGLEEGRLIHLGIMSNLRPASRKLLLADLGGGSCELTLSIEGHIREMASLPLGAVRLTAEFLKHDPPKKKELRRMQELVREELGRVLRRFGDLHGRLMIATSGTAAALAGSIQAWRKQREPLIAADDVRAMAKKLARLRADQRVALPGIGPRRGEIIVAGAGVFAELMSSLHLAGFRYSALGLRDGLLAQMAADYDRGAPLRRQIDRDRRDSLLQLARKFNADLRFAAHIGELTDRLFTLLKPLHGLDPRFGEWLQGAAMLHEIGSFINRAGRRRHSHYVIANSEILGFTRGERQIMATIVRYVGKSKPADTDRIMRALPPAQRQAVAKAVLLLRLARALNQGRKNPVRALRARVTKREVRLRVVMRRGAGDLELWALAKEASYFREVFGRELTLLSD